ncbi:MAG: NADPH-dependent stearoyl-CoA 9-desaturase [Frankiales bacterium]|jgi:linoleoyl-CoA desaturase|nr:NADPH-dependent stearoyl-CoA 9-desaturase [Frankiales bacterium]
MPLPAHLTDTDLEAIGRELDAIRDEVIATRGGSDRAYIKKVVKGHRALETGARVTLLASLFPPAWLAGTTMLSVAKILENMELGHNIMHGQWDWMRDPEIHSTTWDWDNVTPAEDWKHSHNYLHHTYTNIIGKDRDLGYELLRISPDQRWQKYHLAQLPMNVALMFFFEYGIALYDMEIGKVFTGRMPLGEAKRHLSKIWKKIRPQMVKDYVVWPLLSGPSALTTAGANLTANLARNVWTHTVIFCGHFPNDVHEFTIEETKDETRGGWYVRQLLGSANLDGGPLLHLMTGQLSFQIEHHLFPDLPSNRYSEIAPRVREICERYDLPYTSGPLPKQIAQVWMKIAKLSLPPKEQPAHPKRLTKVQPKAA